MSWSPSSFFIKVNKTGGPDNVALGSILMRVQLDYKNERTDDELFVLFGVVIADGRPLDTEWDIYKMGTLNNTQFKDNIPNTTCRIIK